MDKKQHTRDTKDRKKTGKRQEKDRKKTGKQDIIQENTGDRNTRRHKDTENRRRTKRRKDQTQGQ